ncbi:MAG: M23 family metallopeptidase [Pseudomonadota bacterium]
MGLRQSWHRFLERRIPEKRLFLRTDTETRFVRLGSGTQVLALCGGALIVGWAIVATAIILMDTIGSGNFRDQAKRDQQIYEERLNALAEERDARAEEAIAAQERFNTALEQVSLMQSQLLGSEDRRKELERGIEVVQATLRRTIAEREDANTRYQELSTTLAAEGGALPEANQAREVSQTLAYLTEALQNTATERDSAADAALAAADRLAALDGEMQVLEERTDEIFRQLEDAMTISVEPLDRMFRNAGLNTNSLLDAVRRGYSGRGGALSPISYSTRGNDPASADEDRANSIITQLDRLNIYRIAASRAPFALPVRGNFRYTSGFGPRWGRMHRGTDFAAAHGAPIYSTADGVVTKAGWGSGYGRVIYIQHEFGIETRYAHLSRIRVNVGQRVSRGQRIGDMGSSGRSTGTHLHYEVRVNGRAVNPMIYIRAANDVF